MTPILKTLKLRKSAGQASNRLIQLLVIVPFLSASLAQAESRIDGHWWEKAGNDSRNGIVSGLSDCLQYDRQVWSNPIRDDEAARKISEFYHQGPLATPLDLVLLQLPKSRRILQTGEEKYSEKHGYYNGLYWKQISTEGQEAFVLGYLSCRTERVPDRAEVKALIVKIDKQYEEHDEDAKIADVLWKAANESGVPMKHVKPGKLRRKLSAL